MLEGAPVCAQVVFEITYTINHYQEINADAYYYPSQHFNFGSTLFQRCDQR